MGYVLKDLLTSKDFVQIGYSSGLTGYKGAIKVTPEEGVEYDVFDQLNLVYFLKDGMYVPHFIRERSAKGQTLKFERILTREDSLHLTDQPFYARKKDLPESVLQILSEGPEFIHLQGFMIYDVTQDREVGPVSKVEEYPAGWMAEVTASRDDPLLIPLAEPLIERIDEEEEIIYMALPEGLTEL